jgi:hypothetical protein
LHRISARPGQSQDSQDTYSCQRANGLLNTRKTAVRIKLDTLLVVTAKERHTGYLAVSAGCWVKRESHIKQGVMTVVFMMNQAGYPVLEHVPPLPVGAEDVGEGTYLHVVRH